MREDLDRWMAEDELDWILVVGPRQGSGDFQYMTRGAHVHRGPVLKKRGEPAVLLYNPMEVEEAGKSGLAVVSLKELGLHEIARKESDPFRALVLKRVRIFEYFGISGRVGMYGMVAASRYWHLMQELVRLLPDFKPVMPEGVGVITRARRTKDREELDLIADVGRRACGVFAEIQDFLATRPVSGGALQHDGQALTIGKLKGRLRACCAERGLDESGQTIFAQGADGGRPHSFGNDLETICLETPIVFDFFPRDIHTGYYFDMTRSFCLGGADEDYLRRWDLVHRAFTESMAALRPGVSNQEPQNVACQIFEDAGYSTSRSDPTADVGYTHSLGHGIGLDLHEAPSLSLAKSAAYTLEVGNVVTVEPGLYHPGQGWGIRIENAVALTEEGIENLTHVPIEPVVAMRSV